MPERKLRMLSQKRRQQVSTIELLLARVQVTLVGGLLTLCGLTLLASPLGPPVSDSAGAWPGDPEAACAPVPQGGQARGAVLPAGAEAAQPDPPRRGERHAGQWRGDGGGQGPPSATSPLTPAVSAARRGREPGPSAPCGRKQARWAILGPRDPRQGQGSWGPGLH